MLSKLINSISALIEIRRQSSELERGLVQGSIKGFVDQEGRYSFETSEGCYDQWWSYIFKRREKTQSEHPFLSNMVNLFYYVYDHPTHEMHCKANKMYKNRTSTKHQQL